MRLSPKQIKEEDISTGHKEKYNKMWTENKKSPRWICMLNTQVFVDGNLQLMHWINGVYMN